MRLGRRLKSGIVHVNRRTVNEDARAPIGSFGDSGNAARSRGEANSSEFTAWQGMKLRDGVPPRGR